MIKGLVFILLLFLIGCSDKASNDSDTSCKASSQEQEGMLVYGKKFADLMGLPEDKATLKYQQGLLAVRAYWTCMYGQNKHPLLQVQLYLENATLVSLNGEEGSLLEYESITPSGFKYFSGSPKYDKKDERYDLKKDKDYNGFYNRLVLTDLVGIESQPIYRFKKSLVPDVNVIEFGTSFRKDFDVYLYAGKNKPTTKNTMALISELDKNDQVYKNLGFLHFRMPDQLDEFLGLHPVLD